MPEDTDTQDCIEKKKEQIKANVGKPVEEHKDTDKP